MKAYITGFTDEKINEILSDSYYEPSVKALREKAEKLLESEPGRFKYSDMHLFVTTGNRSKFETVRNDYTNRLLTFALAYCFFKDEKYIEPLADIIWNICDFETWALPAHVGEGVSLAERRAFLELVSANVGKLFGEVLALVGEEKLPELVVRRMKNEVRERIIEGYKKYHFGWMSGNHNWSAVCITGILASYIYFAEKSEIDEQLPRMIETANIYLKSFGSDSCCLEGYSYWSYGFSYYCEFADLLRNYTNGEIDMFKTQKVHDIAKFQENCAINDTQCIRFSDCGEYFRPYAYLSHFLKNEYPDMQIPSLSAPKIVSSYIRSFVWLDPSLKNCVMKPESKIYPEAQWFIYRSPEYNFVCKAGSNSEPHNHNDVGSFMVSKNGKVSFTDPGGGEYTRQYFSKDRYSVLEPSARSHSLPIINGEFQKTCAEKAKIYVEEENQYSFSMEQTYGLEALKSLKRSFVCEKDGVVLIDSYEFSDMPESVVERIVTLVKPQIDGGKVFCGDSVLEYDEVAFSLELKTDTCVRGGGGTVTETLYMLDFTPKSLSKNMTLSFKIK